MTTCMYSMYISVYVCKWVGVTACMSEAWLTVLPGLHGREVLFARGLGEHVTVKRDTVLEDGYAGLNGLGSRLKGRVQIEFVDAHGIPEGTFILYIQGVQKRCIPPRPPHNFSSEMT